MTSNFDTSTSEINNSQKDRFELLSAYLDGEVTPTERKQVESWLQNDAQVQQLYRRLMQLRQGFSSLTIPTTNRSPEMLSAQIFRKEESRWQRRMLYTGGAIAAVLVATVSTFLPKIDSPLPQVAQTPATETTSEPLMIAVNRPVVPIPQAAINSEQP